MDEVGVLKGGKGQPSVQDELEELKGAMVELYEIVKHQAQLLNGQKQLISQHIAISKELVEQLVRSSGEDLGHIDRMLNELEAKHDEVVALH